MPLTQGRSRLVFALVAAAIATLAHAAPAAAGRHKVRAGQSLGAIAERYGCSIAELRRANHLRDRKSVV